MKAIAQKGAVSTIAAFILIIVIGSIVSVALITSRSGLTDANEQNADTQALYLAESAIERIKFYLVDNPTAGCNNVPTPPDLQSFNGGTFQIESVSFTDAQQDCTVKVKSTFNGIVKYLVVSFVNSGGAGSGAGINFKEQFIYANTTAMTVDWTEVFAATNSNEGQTIWSGVNCPASNCPGSAGGSLYIETNGSGGNRVMRGYRERTIPTLNTGASGLTVTLTGAWLKKSSTGGTPDRQRLFIELVDSTGGTKKRLWAELNSYGNSGIQLINKTINLAANRAYDSVRLRFNFRGRRVMGTYIHPQAYLDEIEITGSAGGGGVTPDWNIATWQEVES